VKIADVLAPVRLLFLDSSPVIYYVEHNPTYAARVDDIFQRIDNGTLRGAASAVTLAECLVHPFRSSDPKRVTAFCDVVLNASSTTFVALDANVAQHAAELRARYAFTLTDAFQIAAALAIGCDAFLSNDVSLKKVTEIPVLVLDELTL
jgi:predicted nucleic acid-binding protein